ncbi:SAM-dependent DNA methyltransferase [Corallococcus sp. AB011P]|uniref:N-6 DNA methylase n=1 Tax=Corallococcus sp. AB011P TaxID=2316735 RepID=UPI000EA03DD5|nr:N-6 DNA methylase [Corallococcus sp. AB011P]RKG48494.1 SAM-dependent DNA methyltransferase [Corallococcus sp. AB011P]
MDGVGYLNSLGLKVTDAAQRSIGRLALAGEFVLEERRGVLLRPKRGGVSDRYLELLAAEGYAFVVVDNGNSPSMYARAGEGLVPVRALPVNTPSRFPSRDVLAAWAQLIRSAAGRGDAARLGAAQLLAYFDDGGVFTPALVQSNSAPQLDRIGGAPEDDAEPLRTAAALLAGFELRPGSRAELVWLLGALASLLHHKGEVSGLAEGLAEMLEFQQLGARRLVVSGGAGAELSVLFRSSGSAALPTALDALGPVLQRLLPNVELELGDFLHSSTRTDYSGVIVVPPLGIEFRGAQFESFDLAKRGGKLLSRVSAELLYVEHGLAATAPGGVLVAVLPEGLLSSAGHAQFREWLLARARLLAVVSLRAGSCFQGTGVKCSVVLLKKGAPEADYPILMVDADDGDGLIAAKATLDDFLNREVSACA